jgi:Leucine-rich repeat (LRR) protein
MEVIEIKNHQIDEIDIQALSFFSNLNVIDLSFNRLKVLSPIFFKNLNSLSIVSLNHNQIECLDSQLFKDLTNLTEIDLSNNRIKVIYSEIFKGLKKLVKILLHNNLFEGNYLDLDVESSVKFVSFRNSINETCGNNDIAYLVVLLINFLFAKHNLNLITFYFKDQLKLV